MSVMNSRRSILLAQLPIPPAGIEPIVGNVPLAAGYLILHARLKGLDEHYDFHILPPPIANTYSDCGLVEEILSRDPWLVGFSCYLWNINRTLWICQQLKARRPEMLIVLGGPEITSDNAWVLESGCIDYAVIGEGEQTFTELLSALQAAPGQLDKPSLSKQTLIAGLWRADHPQLPLFRKPLANLSEVSSPYLAGILNAADERLLLLETIRGCVFKCKFCYYPKSYDALYFVDQDKVIANLRHAREAGATEVVLLDPTLNQRKDFDDFLRLLARENHDHQFTYFGELRAEGIRPETAQLLKAANFTEVEIGLQSIDPQAQSLMDRKNNLKAFERGVGALMEAGIKVKVDLIIGLPGDTIASVRRGFEYLATSKLFTSTQVFNLAILPGTAFRQEAEQLGLKFQPRPPYYVYETPTLGTSDLYMLMEEAQDVFDSEWDPFPEPTLEFAATAESDLRPIECWKVHLDAVSTVEPPAAAACAQAMCVWFVADDLAAHAKTIHRSLRKMLDANPHSTLQVILEPTGDPHRLQPEFVEDVLSVCYQQPNYLDRYYSLNPQGMLGSKRVVIKVPEHVDEEWADAMLDTATLL